MTFGKVVRSICAGAVLFALLIFAGCSRSAESSAISSVLKAPRVDWGMSLLAGGSVGVGQFPAKFTFDVTAAPDCTNDFVAYNTGAAGAAGVAKIIAYNNLYSMQGGATGLCGNTGPTVDWAYDSDPMGSSQSLTSPILSGDGKKIAWVDNSGNGTLRILKWKTGQGTGASSPATPDQDISGMAWTACMAGNSCIVSIPFFGSVEDTNSPPFYNYSTDELFVGDNAGNIHHFTGVFNGTPAEDTTSFPTAADSGAALTGPVYDSVSGYLFVGDSNGELTRINITGSSSDCSPQPCIPSTNGHLSVGSGGSVVDGPIVDGTNQTVFAINGTNMSGGTLTQAPTNFASQVNASVGNGLSGLSNLFNGAFDNAYLTSSAPNVTGHMYVCGHENSHTNRPAIIRFSFTSAGVLTGSGTQQHGLAGADGEACSPVTEFYNSTTSTDWIFFSIGNNASTTDPIPSGSACRTTNAGCVLSIDLTGVSWPPSDVTNAVPVPANAAGSTSGIIVDNVSSSSQASSIYFSLGTNSTGTGPGLPSCNTTSGVGCAVKLTQSGLQ